MEQLEQLADQIHNEMGTYDKERSEEAAGLLQAVEQFIGEVNTDHRTALDNQVGALEAFLGI